MIFIVIVIGVGVRHSAWWSLCLVLPIQHRIVICYVGFPVALSDLNGIHHATGVYYVGMGCLCRVGQFHIRPGQWVWCLVGDACCCFVFSEEKNS